MFNKLSDEVDSWYDSVDEFIRRIDSWSCDLIGRNKTAHQHIWRQIPLVIKAAPRHPYVLINNLKSGGKIELPRPTPAFVMPLTIGYLVVKYRLTIAIDGVITRPNPAPVWK